MHLGVIGCGKMGGAMLKRWLDSGAIEREKVHAITATEANARRVNERLGVRADTDVPSALKESDLVLLAIKPQQARALLPTWAAHVPRGQPWLSVLAGTPMRTLEETLRGRAEISRLMPNTPSAVGEGATAVVWSPALSARQRQEQRALLDHLGGVYEMREDQIDAFTTLAGSGPAYVFLFMESLAAAGMKLGIDEAQAQALALQVIVGAGALARHEARPAAELRAAVTSPGGVTEAAIATLRDEKWPEAMEAAVRAALRRTTELAKL